MADVILEINGRQYGGWEEIEIRRGIEQVAGTFELTVSDRWAGRDQALPIRIGDACTVSVDGDTAITGYVDDVLPFFDVKRHGMTVVGRDATGDLVDCSAIAASGEWRGRNILQVASDICKPFGITVRAETSVGKAFTSAALQEGETAWEALERAARMRGLLMISDAQGGLAITRAGTERVGTDLIQGKNVKAARGTFSMRDRYSRYVCKGQNVGFDTDTPDQNAGPKGEATDGSVSRYRPLIIVAEDIGDAAALDDRAVWEAAVRMGRSARPLVTVQGWHHASGLWAPNKRVRLDCPYLHLDADMLIVAVAYRLDKDAGTTTDIELCPPTAFDLLPVPEDDGGAPW